MDTALNTRLLAALPPRSSIPLRARIVDYEIVEMAVLLRSRELTSYAVTVAYLQRIDEFNGPFETYDTNGGYNAFVRIDRTEALTQARDADLWLQNSNDERGPAPPLCGIPIGVKDSIGIKGRESKNGTQAFTGNVALQDATCVSKLREQGAVLLGHNICSAYSGDINGTFAGNAWDLERVCGGSSQGSGVAPVARLCAASLGEETGGSLILPVSANGASGIKPSLGLVSVAGLMPLRNGIDVIGPVARSIRDASLVLSVISAMDQLNDPHTLSAPIPLPELPISSRAGDKPLEGLTIGIPQQDWMMPGTTLPPAENYDADYKKAFNRFKEQLIYLGATVKDFPGLNIGTAECPFSAPVILGEIIDGGGNVNPITPLTAVTYSNAVETGFWLAVAEFSAGSLPAHRTELLGMYFQNTGIGAEKVTVAMRAEGERRRREEQKLYQKALDEAGVDFMLVMPLGAHVGRRFEGTLESILVRRLQIDVPNLHGWPMLSFPIGFGQTGLSQRLPINAAFWGPRFSEALIIQAAIDFQVRFSGYHDVAPPDPPMPGPKRPPHIPRVRPVTPETSTDPVVRQGVVR